MGGRFTSNSEYGAANLVALVLEYRKKHGDIDERLVALAGAIDDKIAQLKNELLGGAGSAFDTFKELQDLFLDNKNLIEELKTIAGKHIRFDIDQALTIAEKARVRNNIGAVSQDYVDAAVADAMPSAPTASVTKVGSVAVITIKDKNGMTSASISDGTTGAVYQPIVDDEGNISWTNNGGLANPATKNIRGEKGEKGDAFTFDDLTEEQKEQLRGQPGEQGGIGPRGYTFTPSVSSSGVITWTNNGGLTNPSAVNIKGPKGDQGVQGIQGIQGVPGEIGPRGVTFTPSLSSDGVLSFTNDGELENPTPVDLTGPQGPRGQKGDTGAGLTILGEYANYDALVAAHPTGKGGDAYLVAGELYYWAEEQSKWASAGELQGPKGTDGQAPTISFRVDADGGLYYSIDYIDNGDAEAY